MPCERLAFFARQAKNRPGTLPCTVSCYFAPIRLYGFSSRTLRPSRLRVFRSFLRFLVTESGQAICYNPAHEPRKMTEPSTPLMRQYAAIKRDHPTALLFFRLGDFYELFFDDAVVASRELQITLTSRNKEKGIAVPMCGVPYHSAEGYIAKLIRKGFKVAICDQVEDAKVAKKLVRREVTRVVTPGTADISLAS